MNDTILGLIVMFWMFVTPFIAASIAEARGRTGWAWALGAFFGLGAMAVVLLLVLPINTQGVEERLIKTGERERCHSCRELVRPSAGWCSHCTRMLLP